MLTRSKGLNIHTHTVSCNSGWKHWQVPIKSCSTHVRTSFQTGEMKWPEHSSSKAPVFLLASSALVQHVVCAVYHAQHIVHSAHYLGWQSPICIYIYTVHMWCFWQGHHQIYGQIRCRYTVPANPTHHTVYRLTNTVKATTLKLVSAHPAWSREGSEHAETSTYKLLTVVIKV
jgi:hypothetical protein